MASAAICSTLVRWRRTDSSTRRNSGMDIISDLAEAVLRQETILTIGAFDGVHRGHQALIADVVARARSTDRLAAAITFHPHPAVMLAPNRAPPCLTTPGEKAALLEGLNLDLLALLPFNRQMAATPARDFVATVSRNLRMRELWVGSDFAMGRDREGDVPRLREFGRELGYDIHVVQPVVTISGDVISSSLIRTLLSEGRVEEAAGMLGRNVSLSGEVVVGAGRGRRLGFATANLDVRPERSVPADGVYAAFAMLGAESFEALANIGVRPSFGNGMRTVETHILDFDRDIYGCDLVVEFVARLRDEQRFAECSDLVAQVSHDIAAAREVLSSPKRTRRSAQPGMGAAGGKPLMECPYRYEEVDHTADRAMRVWGNSLQSLFIGAARGMYRLMADLDGLVATEWCEILVESSDSEALLVEWLNELLFLTEMKGLLFVDYQIDSLTGSSLVGRAGGVSAEPSKAHIKAATYHDLLIVRNGTGCSTVITFDV
jgi:riboflavin kinase/FMN adenylyltransferase